MLLIILYIAFIILGLPGALLGSAWPTIQNDLGMPVFYAGIISMLINGGMIFSSLMADRLTRWMRPVLVVSMGVLLMAVGVFGFSVSAYFWLMCLWGFTLGFGSGAVDAVINNYLATHYTSKQMNWLHCFWGLGAMIGPYIMGFYLVRGLSWGYGFGTVGAIQIVFLMVLIGTQSLWRRNEPVHNEGDAPIDTPPKKFSQLMKIPGVKLALFAFFAYCAVETTAGLWASTYLVYNRGVSMESAALFGSLFFIGMTAGRFGSGFISNHMGESRMIKLGSVIVLVGIAAVWLSMLPTWVSLAGLVIIGLGCAPIFPAFIQATPAKFGAENSQALIGIQMAAAYTGSTLIPPLFGMLVDFISISIFPAFLFLFFLFALICNTFQEKIIK